MSEKKRGTTSKNVARGKKSKFVAFATKTWQCNIPTWVTSCHHGDKLSQNLIRILNRILNLDSESGF